MSEVISGEEIKELINNDEELDKILISQFQWLGLEITDKINLEQLSRLLNHSCELLNIPTPKGSEVEDLLKGHDYDESGSIDYSEFRVLYRRLLINAINIIEDY